MKKSYLITLSSSVILFMVFIVSCSNSDFVANSTVDFEDTKKSEINLSVIDGRLMFETSNDFAKFVSLDQDNIVAAIITQGAKATVIKNESTSYLSN